MATLLLGTWTREIDLVQVERVLTGHDASDESTMSAHSHGPSGAPEVEDSVAEKADLVVGAGAR